MFSARREGVLVLLMGIIGALAGPRLLTNLVPFNGFLGAIMMVFPITAMYALALIGVRRFPPAWMPWIGGGAYLLGAVLTVLRVPGLLGLVLALAPALIVFAGSRRGGVPMVWKGLFLTGFMLLTTAWIFVSFMPRAAALMLLVGTAYASLRYAWGIIDGEWANL